jgi:triphosphoribosyl-dephospho-CoA synthase
VSATVATPALGPAVVAVPDGSQRLAALAVRALVEEAELTPKPALVDARGPGAHADLSLELMRRSAHALTATFAALARCAAGQPPSHALRERLATVGRSGERAMLEATGGVNTHRGAIWSLGLLVAGAAMTRPGSSVRQLAAVAGAVARHPDRFSPPPSTNGARARARYRVGGAPAEAARGFPHVVDLALPALAEARAQGLPEREARLDALLAVMCGLEDTCLLHRGGWRALETARRGAAAVLAVGGSSTPAGRRALLRLDRALVALGASPGGSADLLGAALFLDGWRGIAGAIQEGEGRAWRP